ncbi:MAG: type II toxin-antitoxin system VapC family toxin [Deltaproteobacteria bacterium]|nr:type II toxin-antitoxin system VapC family toxin [Deltaproteobacteria bacterium]
MIAFDTNALVRMLVEDDPDQAKIVDDVVTLVEKNSGQIIILTEVLIETVWVLESVYHCTRKEIYQFLEALISTSAFTFGEASVIRTAISQYRRGGDFADLVIVNQARRLQAKKLVSFDKKLQKRFPGYVVDSIKVDVDL